MLSYGACTTSYRPFVIKTLCMQIGRSATIAGIAAAVVGAAAGVQMFITPAARKSALLGICMLASRQLPEYDPAWLADAIATQTDMYARPQMSDQNKGQKTGQVLIKNATARAAIGIAQDLHLHCFTEHCKESIFVLCATQQC